MVKFIAPHLNKPEERFNWILETDKQMSKVHLYFIRPTNKCRLCFCFLKGGPGNADKPFVWLKLEAIKNFEDPATVRSLTPLLYSFMKDELKLEKVIDNCKILIR